MYDELDRRILEAVSQRINPLWNRAVLQEAGRIARETGREDFRVTDGRLQALRKAGKIRHLTKAESNGRGGWHIVTDSKGKA